MDVKICQEPSCSPAERNVQEEGTGSNTSWNPCYCSVFPGDLVDLGEQGP